MAMIIVNRKENIKSYLSVFLLTLVATTGFSFPAKDAKVKKYSVLSQPLTVRWRYDSNVTLNLTPAFDKDRIYLPLAGGSIVSLNARDGQLVWRSEMGGELCASPVADDSMIFVASETVGSGQSNHPAGTLRALGREGGVTQWMMPLVKPLRGSMTISGGRLFAGGSDGRAYAFDKRTGGVFWSIPFAAALNGRPVAANGHVYFGSEDGTLLALEEATGKLLWHYQTKGAIHGPVAVANGDVFFGSGDGYVYSVSGERGKLNWRKRTGGGVEAILLAGDGLLAASLDNFAYLLNLKGGLVWRKLLPGRISSQPISVDEAALFTPLSSTSAVVLALRDGKQLNSLPTGEEMTSSASPLIVGDTVVVTTEHGVLAFAPPVESPSK